MRMNTAREHSEQQMKQSRWGFRGMTVRDWLQLLIVPLALVVISFLFTTQQDARQQHIENQRAEAERELAEQRAQDEALQAYLDQMSSLLLNGELRTSDEDSEVRNLARARTLTVLGGLDQTRKSAVLQFLVEAELVQRVEGRGPIIRLSGANLSGAVLRGYADLGDLSSGSLSRLNNLSGADLSGANLSKANLRGADLSDANLSPWVYFHGLAIVGGGRTDLSNANLSGADFSGANLSKANGVSEEKLEEQAKTLKGATMPDGSEHP